jgi:hypothetical protein
LKWKLHCDKSIKWIIDFKVFFLKIQYNITINFKLLTEKQKNTKIFAMFKMLLIS